MFNRTKEKDIDLVSCETCKLCLKKQDAHEVRSELVSVWSDFTTSAYYCPEHKKPYDIVVSSMLFGARSRYYRLRAEVDENGKLVEQKMKS